eukprot:42721-Eustigmatos_ZCMA.PRE.1
MADIGSKTTSEILEDLKRVAKEDQLDPEDVKSVLRLRLIEALSVQDRKMQITKDRETDLSKVWYARFA